LEGEVTFNRAELEAFFNPGSIAIVGASNNTGKPSGRPLAGLLQSGYRGDIFPVNPRYRELMGLRCFPSLAAVPQEVDLAIIAVPAQQVLAALGECADKGVKAAIVITSGFAEVDRAGEELQQEITRLSARTGLRVCGPNTLGIISAPASLDASFVMADLAKTQNSGGFLGFVTQSGGFGYGIYEMIRPFGLGFSHFISSGNEADVSFADYIHYLAGDPHTRVIGGYLEGVRKGAALAAALDAALAAGKPVVLIKTGRSQEAARAASSHTGSLVGRDSVYESLFRQKGVIRVESFHEMLSVYTVLFGSKTPRGNRVGIVATSGGAGVYLADKCAEYGLTLADYTETTKEVLRNLLPPFVAVNNPVDLTSFAMGKPGMLLSCCAAVAEDPNVDIVFICNFADERSENILRNEEPDSMFPFKLSEIAAFVRDCPKPVLNLVWGHPVSCRYVVCALTANGAPAVYEMEYGVKSMGALVRNTARGRRKDGRRPPVVPAGAKEKVAAILQRYRPGDIIGEHDAKKILSCYGIPTVGERKAKNAASARKAALELGFPVALKIDSPDISHKTEAGGVVLNLRTPEELEQACNSMAATVRQREPGARIEGFLVQEMLPRGVELIIGISRDEVFGPLLLFGLGGILVEAIQDVSLGLPPLAPGEALEMVESLKGRRLLDGYRGLPPVDKDEAARILSLLGQLAVDFPQILELDVNPLIGNGKDIRAADALVVLA
jgi:acetyltransferase